MRDFKNTNIPHFKAIRREHADQLEDILENKYPVDMLTKCFQVQAFYPTQVSTDVNHIAKPRAFTEVDEKDIN
jgi:hypothetical protein